MHRTGNPIVSYFTAYPFDADLALAVLQHLDTRHTSAGLHSNVGYFVYRRRYLVDGGFAWLGRRAPGRNFFPEIDVHNTATSFVLYLIETHGAEAYMQAHFNVGRFEYVYGVTLGHMIDEWREFIGAPRPR